MDDILGMTVREFVAATAARQPAPGGGSVAALGGALAAALGAMAVAYTVGKKKFAPHEVELQAALKRFHHSAGMLEQLMKEDSAAYESLAEFLKLPEQERLAHADYPAAVVAAVRAPQAVAGFAMDILEQCARLPEKTSKHLVSDLGIAATYAHATVQASELNVRVNLPLLPDPAEAQGMRNSLRALALKADTVYGPLREQLLGRL